MLVRDRVFTIWL